MICNGCVIKGQKMDVLVVNQVVVKLKAETALRDIETAQTLSYLAATGRIQERFSVNSVCSVAVVHFGWADWHLL
ncbi:MAG: GxxExxY protein [Planctomycetota bacterium]